MKRINLALQGGGAHGAFTWGVLDRLLEERELGFTGISGTSAGAMNAVVMVSGYMKGGYDGARAALDGFWMDVSEMGELFNPFRFTPMEQLCRQMNLDMTAFYNAFDIMTRLFSPYEFNPLNINPLESVLRQYIDEEAVQACSTIRLFIAATHVESGMARIFECRDITTEAVLASACLPMLFQAVEIDGEPYWDGGYMGNPLIWPLIYRTATPDILLVQINPLSRPGTPKRSIDIINRLNEITFNSSLMAEMRAIRFVSQLLEEHRLESKKYRDILMHRIALMDEEYSPDASGKMNPHREFLLTLKELGRQRTDDWLRAHWKDIGRKSTVDIVNTWLRRRNTPESGGEAA